jgi:predicted nucleic acid-binding protein
MSRSSTLCLDASVVVRLVGSPPDDVVKRRWVQWRTRQQAFVAPDLIFYEVANALYRQYRAHRYDEEGLRRAMRMATELPIELHREDYLHIRALELADEYGLQAAYDAHYMALAERLGVEFWTTDRKLVDAVSKRLAWVRLVE